MFKRVFLFSIFVIGLFTGCANKNTQDAATDAEEIIEEIKAERNVVAKHTYTHDDSKFSIVLSTEGENDCVWDFSYEAIEENEAATAYTEIYVYANSFLKELNNRGTDKISRIGSIIVTLPDERYIIGDSLVPTTAKNSNGDVVVGEMPDWYDYGKIDFGGEVSTFIKESFLDDFIYR